MYPEMFTLKTRQNVHPMCRNLASTSHTKHSLIPLRAVLVLGGGFFCFSVSFVAQSWRTGPVRACRPPFRRRRQRWGSLAQLCRSGLEGVEKEQRAMQQCINPQKGLQLPGLGGSKTTGHRVGDGTGAQMGINHVIKNLKARKNAPWDHQGYVDGNMAPWRTLFPRGSKGGVPSDESTWNPMVIEIYSVGWIGLAWVSWVGMWVGAWTCLDFPMLHK